MMLKVDRFLAADYVNALRSLDETYPWITDPWATGAAYAQYGPAFTIWSDGQIAAVLGIMIPWAGRGECWALLTPLGLRHGAVVHRLTIRYLRRLIRDHKLVRLEAEVIADFHAGRRWLRHLGFHLESIMPHFGPRGETFARFAWFHPAAVPQNSNGHAIAAMSDTS